MNPYLIPRWVAELGDEKIQELLASGVLRVYEGRIVPVIAGADDSVHPFTGTPYSDFADIPEDLTSIGQAELAGLITDLEAVVAEVAADPLSFIAQDFDAAQLLDATRIAVARVQELKAEAARRLKVEFAELAEAAAEAAPETEAAAETDPDPDPDAEPEADPDQEAAAATETESVTAGALPVPGSRQIAETEPQVRQVALVAAAGARDVDPGTPFESELALAESMIKRHASFGRSGPETVEKFSIARADWKGDYPADRRLSKDEESNWEIVRPVIDQAAIKRELATRISQQDSGALVASGGLCAPVTPYYNLQFISTPRRPVMASLPSFVADRGGLRYARPAALSAITTGIGLITEAEDNAGGTFATKTCQVIDCPPFQETDVDILYHCLQFGNLGARTFPELVAQWNNLVLAAHARMAESNLLTIIDAASTQVTASALGLGASATLFSQILAAANGLRSRNRMDPEAVLRIMLPWWSVDLIVSDVIRTQFERFDTDRARVTALLRSFNIEPTFYIDGANGRNQVFGTQAATALLPFPSKVVWYLFPEGSFLYLDGGTLELGIVRDSVLNQTNDFQIFGETFESVAFVGVESLAVASTVCDSGTVSLPHAVACPISYA